MGGWLPAQWFDLLERTVIPPFSAAEQVRFERWKGLAARGDDPEDPRPGLAAAALARIAPTPGLTRYARR